MGFGKSGEGSVIYGDAPVCDFKSWPGGRGKGKGSPADWRELLKCYAFKDEAEALAYRGNPVDILQPLVKAKIALIHVVETPMTWCPLKRSRSWWRRAIER